MIYVVNYADASFSRNRKYSTLTAYKKGKADKVIEYTPDDIDRDFKKKHANIFSYKRGAGLWLWKPYIISKALKKIDEGDYLFYCDAGTVFVNKIQLLIDVMEKQKHTIMLFELPL